MIPVTALREIPGFGKLPESVLRAIHESAIPKKVEGGQIIYLQGELPSNLYILLKGWVKSSRMTKEGREQGLLFLKPIDLFGLVSVFTNKPYPATVTSLGAAELLVIPQEDFLNLVKKHIELSFGIIDNLCQRNLHFINLIEDLSLRSVESRLAATLFKNAESIDGELVVPREHWTTFDEMAVRLGTVRDVLSRALKTLEGENLIQVTRTRIVILDPEGLLERCDADPCGC